MKKLVAALALAIAPMAVQAAEQNAVADLIGIATAAASSPSAKSLAQGVLPAGSLDAAAANPQIVSGAVVSGGKVVGGSLPMALSCEFKQPNACVAEGTAVPFHKAIIQATGETSFVIERIQVNTNLVTIYFHLLE